MQKGPVGLLDNVFLSLPDPVPLLCVRNSPGLLDLAQLLKAVIEALATEKVHYRSNPETDALGLYVYNSSSEQQRGEAPTSP